MILEPKNDIPSIKEEREKLKLPVSSSIPYICASKNNENQRIMEQTAENGGFL